MLGNVKPYLPQLSEDAKTKYNAYYCGLCKTLGRQNGLFSRFLLNYDMVFTAMIYDSFNGCEYVTENKACFANPFKKKTVIKQTKGALYRADVLIMLAYFKVKDDIRDENFLKKIVYTAVLPYFYLKYRQAAKRNPELALQLKTQSEKQSSIEKSSHSLDRLCMPTAAMVKAIISGCADNENKLHAGQMGFFLGRVIYLADALADRREDMAKGRFNAFNAYNCNEEQAKAECFMALGELAHWYSLLDLKDIKEITDNIIYMSLARNIKFAGKEEENGK